LREPDLLLLDEPTNHLDVESILWLEEFLASARFATMTITHDRLFLQRIASNIWDLDRRNPGGLLVVKGTYADYIETKDSMMAAQESSEVRLKNTLRRETEWLRRGAKARTTKQQARIQRHAVLSDAVSELEYRNETRSARMDFVASEKAPKKLLEARGISKSHGGRKLFEPLDIVLAPGSRLALMGPNGCGKSTLIRILLGEEKPDTGEIKTSEHLQVSYFEQNRDSLDPKLSVLQTICPRGDYVDYRGGRVHVKSYLDRFLFDYGQMEMAVGKLSGGEQSRILIAKLMLKEANLLVLDEPTNDLDVRTLNVLQDCLTDFQGAVLLVTHDRYFLDQVATQILAFPPGRQEHPKVVPFADLAQWEAWHARERESAARAPNHSSESQFAPAAAPKAAPRSASKKKLSFKDQRELDAMEETIRVKEERLTFLTGESEKGDNMSNALRLNEIVSEMHQLQSEIEKLFTRWADLEK
jgi:ATP-binding cassette subfamily F protein uup